MPGDDWVRLVRCTWKGLKYQVYVGPGSIRVSPLNNTESHSQQPKVDRQTFLSRCGGDICGLLRPCSSRYCTYWFWWHIWQHYCGVAVQHVGQISLQHLARSFISSKIIYFKQHKSLWIVFFPQTKCPSWEMVRPCKSFSNELMLFIVWMLDLFWPSTSIFSAKDISHVLTFVNLFSVVLLTYWTADRQHWIVHLLEKVKTRRNNIHPFCALLLCFGFRKLISIHPKVFIYTSDIII